LQPACRVNKEIQMSIAKIVELSCESETSFEHAIQSGMKRAEETLQNVTGAWISEQKIVAKKGVITLYRVIMRVSFVLK